MADAKWVELEYGQLRGEIATLISMEQSAIRFYLPVIGSVYAVPYLLNDTGQAYLWTVCVAVAGLLTLALAHSLLEAIEGIRRIGAYLKVVVEPETGDGVRWERCLSKIYQRHRLWANERLVITSGLVLGNVVAASAAANLFLADGFLWPIATALLLAVPAILAMVRMSRSSTMRREYTEKFLAAKNSLAFDETQ